MRISDWSSDVCSSDLPEVRINSVCPGFVEGEWLKQGMGEAAYEATRQTWMALAPLGRANTAEDVAANIAFFLTAAPPITGENLIIDAGMRLAAPPQPAARSTVHHRLAR